MAYTPKTWVCGETITADGLNNIEDGIQEALECCGGTTENEIFAVKVDVDVTTPSEDAQPTTADKTFAEVKQAYEAGKIIKVYGVVTQGGVMKSIKELPTSYEEMNGELVVITGEMVYSAGNCNGEICMISRLMLAISEQGTFYIYNRGGWG